MNNLYAFLHPETPEQKEVVFNRFKDEQGNVVPLVIKPISAEENAAIIKRCTVTTKDRGENKRVDSAKYQASIIVAGTVVPDFSDEKLCEAYGTMDPEEVPAKMLLAGEFMKIVTEILSLSGLSDAAAEEDMEEAKN